MTTKQRSTHHERTRARRQRTTPTHPKRSTYCHLFRPGRRLTVLHGGELLCVWVCRRCRRRIWGQGRSSAHESE
jgi:hypothetical protein